MDKIIKMLKEHDIAPSVQRIKILEYLRSYKIHPSADMIYQALSEEMPTLSKTTVYNALKVFTEAGILDSLSFLDNEIRYDFIKTPHIHFKCEKCNQIYDIQKDPNLNKKNMIEGHKVLNHHINLTGICKKCLKKEN